MGNTPPTNTSPTETIIDELSVTFYLGPARILIFTANSLYLTYIQWKGQIQFTRFSENLVVNLRIQTDFPWGMATDRWVEFDSMLHVVLSLLDASSDLDNIHVPVHEHACPDVHLYTFKLTSDCINHKTSSTTNWTQQPKHYRYFLLTCRILITLISFMLLNHKYSK